MVGLHALRQNDDAYKEDMKIYKIILWWYTKILIYIVVFLFYKVLNKEFYNLQASTDKQINELQCTNTEVVRKLSIYEKLEQELDDVILQAAQCKYRINFHIQILEKVNNNPDPKPNCSAKPISCQF